MTVSSDEVVTPDEALNEALIAFTACIGDALTDICSYGLTIGESYVPFEPDDDDDCEDGIEACEQAWVRVMSVTPKPGDTGWDGNCGLVLMAELEVGVLRCIEARKNGEAPTSTQVMAAAMQSMTDMITIEQAALGCEVWDSLELGQWVPEGPLGGQYGGTWTFTVEIDQCFRASEDTTGGRVCGLWTGHGAPDSDDLPDALDGDEYLDLDTGTIYTLSI